MIETLIKISLYRKEDLETLENVIASIQINSPFFVLEFDNSYQLNLTTEFELPEIEEAILKHMKGYKFTEDIGNGRKEIRMRVIKEQSILSTDGWGRPLENPLNSIKYLIKKTPEKENTISKKVKVLYKNINKDFYVNVINGINTTTQEKGFLVMKSHDENPQKTKNQIKESYLFKDKREAFWHGYNSLENHIYNNLKEIEKEYKNLKRKYETRNQRKK